MAHAVVMNKTHIELHIEINHNPLYQLSEWNKSQTKHIRMNVVLCKILHGPRLLFLVPWVHFR